VLKNVFLGVSYTLVTILYLYIIIINMHTRLLLIILGTLFVATSVFAIIGWTRGNKCSECKACTECKVCTECTSNSSKNYSNVDKLAWETISDEVADALTRVYDQGQWSDTNTFAYNTGGTLHNGIFFLGRALGYERFVQNRSDQDLLRQYTSSNLLNFSSVISICRAQGDCDPISFQFSEVFTDLWDTISNDVDDKDIVMLQLYTLQRFAEGYMRSSAIIN